MSFPVPKIIFSMAIIGQLILLSGCSKIYISSVASFLGLPDLLSPDVTISAAVNETVGGCSFVAVADPYNAANFSYKISFSENIDATTFDLTDITNAGTGVVTWTIQNCGDDTNYKLLVTAITSDGTVVPEITDTVVKDLASNDNNAFFAIDNSITVDTLSPSVTVEQAITQVVGTCSFTAYAEPYGSQNFSYRITFSETINASTFSTSDITNSGSGGSTVMEWELVSCGDNRNYKLIAHDVHGNGTIIPLLAAARVQDPAGNNNLLATSADNSVNFQKTGWYQEAFIKAVNADFYDGLGRSVAIDRDTIAVGAPEEESPQTTITNGPAASADNSSSYVGAVYVYKRTGSTWVQEAYIKAANASGSMFYSNGWDSGGVAIDNDTLVVGATDERSNQTTITNGTSASADTSEPYSGAAYVYRRTGSTWAQEAYIKASNGEEDDIFGLFVEVQGDTIAITNDDSSSQTTITNGTGSGVDNNFYYSGAVFIYKRNGTNWAQEAYIKAANSEAYLGFGYGGVSLDGNTLAVGTYFEDSYQTTISNGTLAPAIDTERIASGAIYVYKRTGTTWAQEAFIKATNADAFDYFGNSVALSGDFLAVGAPYESSNQLTITNGSTASSDNSALYSGAVYVYKRTLNAWAQDAYLKASNNSSSQYFGNRIALSGNTLIVSSEDDSNQTTITNDVTSSSDVSKTNSGAVFVYNRGSNGWYQEAYIKSVNAQTNDIFGLNLAISGDTIAVGVPDQSSNVVTITNGPTASSDTSLGDSGAVYVYRNVEKLFDPSNSVLVSNNSNSMQISWSKAGLKATGYKIAYNLGLTPPANCNSGTVIDVGTLTTYIISSLLGGQNYSFRICSYDSAGYMSPGYTSTYQTAAYTPEVTSLAVTPNTVTAVTISWVNGGGATTGYKLAWQSGNTPPADCTIGTVVDVGVSTSYQVTGLVGNIGVRVCSYDSSGNLSFGNFITAQRPTAPEPTLVKITSSDTTSATIHWTSGGGVTTGFRVAWVTGKTTPVDCSSHTNADVGNVTSYAINGLTPGEQISARVCSYQVAGDDISIGVGVTGSVWDTGWNQEAYIKRSNSITEYDANFGWEVSIDGDTLAVGAKFDESNQTTITNGTSSSSDRTLADSGAVYIYKRTGVNWVQEAYIKASNAEASDEFGANLQIHRDTLVVGTFEEDSNQTTITNGTTASANNANLRSGAAYVYKRTGSTWVQEAYIKAVNSEASDFFGMDVTLYDDTIVVGASGEDSNQITITNGATASANNALLTSGAAYVYRRTGVTWAQEAYIKAANVNTSDNFGEFVSLHRDTLAVGADGEDSNLITITNGTGTSANNTSLGSGAVYIYKRTGSSWAQEAYIKASNANAGDGLGPVQINFDTLVAVATFEQSNQTTITNSAVASADNSFTSAGAVYVYQRSGVTWSQTSYIKPSNNSDHLRFGFSHSISGNTLVVSTTVEKSNQTTITNGATASADTSLNNAGAAYVFVRSGSNWSQEAYIKAVNQSTQDQFGRSASISGDTIAIGSIYEDGTGTTITNGTSATLDNLQIDTGAVYVYRNNARLFEVPDFWGIGAGTSVTLNWQKSGGTAVGYFIAYQAGATAPANCTSGTYYDVGDVLTYTETGLVALATYSFRICSDDGSTTSEGVTLTVRL